MRGVDPSELKAEAFAPTEAERLRGEMAELQRAVETGRLLREMRAAGMPASESPAGKGGEEYRRGGRAKLTPARRAAIREQERRAQFGTRVGATDRAD